MSIKNKKYALKSAKKVHLVRYYQSVVGIICGKSYGP